MVQKELIQKFVKGADYYMVRFDKDEAHSDMGKILNGDELLKLNVKENEIHRSINYSNDDKLFVFDLKPKSSQLVGNPLQLLKDNLKEAKIIEMIYPNIFTWVFDGLSVKAYAVIPSGNVKQHSTISRYGGSDMFFRILRQHLSNIGNMGKGKTPNYSFLKDNDDLPKTELCIGSVNRFTNLFSIVININSNYMKIIKDSMNLRSKDFELNKLNMKYWAREINPDFISEAKHIKLKSTLPTDMDIDELFALYPEPIKAIMALKDKGNYNRFLLARFLLSVHKPSDAKHIYYLTMGEEELEHVKAGNCSTQWNYIVNNFERYGCPSMKELKKFTPPGYELSHPLEEIQKYLDETEEEDAKEKED